jgi:hypothetical protein
MSTEGVVGGTAGLAWFKSSYSGSGGGDCIEVSATSGIVHVRDSKDVQGPVLKFSAEEWSAFVSFARSHAAG